uniref:Metabotropic glutamate receptor 1 n=1 Tax=Rhipicephalus zambeziensis TaxID=60191 RepID=A0A224Z415_9ACAR
MLLKKIDTYHIVWFPTHMGQIEGAPSNLNESAHRAARGFVDRVAIERSGDEVLDNKDPPTTYNELAKNFCLRRQKYPPPHSKLNRPQALTLRLLQVGAYPSPALLHKIYPEIQTSDTCVLCSDFASLEHMLWRCPALRVHEDVTSSRWDAALRSPDLKNQLWAVQRAHDVAERQGLSVPTWERPATC